MKKVLQELINGNVSVEEAEKMLKTMQIAELEDFAKLDTARDIRTGFPEAIFAEGKNDQELVKIIRNCANRGRVLVTRLKEDRYINIKEKLESLRDEGFKVEYNTKARVLLIKDQEIERQGKIGIITAGTSDIPVAEEARIVAEEAGCEVITAYDVGVAGIHRLFSQIRRILEEEVKAIIVVAGMEGALPSVVAGLVDIPVIGVPTSVGYGVGTGGFTALNAMLQSCAPGIAVVNIDNGFGAAVFAVTVVKQTEKD
ncbi:nickel pincer cofactor biosynthesis protein LarB [Methanobacterium petrolearium]|uniref:nickel pincer cofactor biosynthesis protein LarB n=1 Tax=Methanobacterium petrolearium TaxID=710190 RepID=UPI001AE8432D|nr:nickel pincer cofactor biosynthesis protein LarB [Methanobacterium petrolearium]